MQRICLAALGFAVLGLPIAAARGDDAAEIRKLVPSATAISHGDFGKLAQAEASPKASDVEDKSLTLLLLCHKVPKDEDDAAKAQFHFLMEFPKPSELATEWNRSVLLPVTAIHRDRITDLTCEVKGDVAQGTIKFEAPKLYAGKVDYVARRTDGKWRIEEFSMPAIKIHIVRSDKGKWVEKEPRK